ncbi:MAG: glutamine amidotransferase [Rhizobiaceae bacterium]
MKRLVLVRHNHVPIDDRVAVWAFLNGYKIDLRYPFSGDSLDDVVAELSDTSDIAGTVIYGGPFNADSADDNPFLIQEYRWIEACMKADLPMLGLCQGVQQIAHHLGAWTGPGEGNVYEFGYYQLTPTEAAKEEGFMNEPVWVTQAHFHTFDLPAGAVHLARSETYQNQAFRLGQNVYGLQGHPEQTIEGFRRWQNAKWANYGEPGAQTRDEQNHLMALHDEAQGKWFYGFLDRFFGPAA